MLVLGMPELHGHRFHPPPQRGWSPDVGRSGLVQIDRPGLHLPRATFGGLCAWALGQCPKFEELLLAVFKS